MLDHKKKQTVSCADVMGHLNSNLKDEIQIEIAAKLLKKVTIFKEICNERL